MGKVVVILAQGFHERLNPTSLPTHAACPRRKSGRWVCLLGCNLPIVSITTAAITSAFVSALTSEKPQESLAYNIRVINIECSDCQLTFAGHVCGVIHVDSCEGCWTDLTVSFTWFSLPMLRMMSFCMLFDRFAPAVPGTLLRWSVSSECLFFYLHLFVVPLDTDHCGLVESFVDPDSTGEL